jgi:hypothetical protein
MHPSIRSRVSALAPIATAIYLVSCGAAHDVETDAAIDAPTVDASTTATCELVAGRYHKCGADCPYMCTAADGPCDPQVGVCVPTPTIRTATGSAEHAERCDFNAARGGLDYCSTGYPCAATRPIGAGCSWPSTDAAPAFCGTCVPQDLCLAARSSGLDSFECVWSDGTPVVTGSPPGGCPTALSPNQPFCGGSCGLVNCPPVPGRCVGVSDQRAFGVCETGIGRCQEDDPTATEQSLTFCTGGLGHGSRCRCLYLMPQASPAGHRGGIVVLAGICEAYQAAFPANVECM